MVASKTFSSREEAVHHAEQLLRARLELPDDAMKKLISSADLIQKVSVKSPKIPKTASPALARSFRYVIRDDDLYTLSNFLDVLKAAGALAIGITSLPTLAGFKALGDAVQGIYTTFKNIFARGELLSAEEFLIVIALKDLETSSAENIAEILRGGSLEIHANAVESFLSRHERGDNKGFTRRVPPDKWCLDGI